MGLETSNPVTKQSLVFRNPLKTESSNLTLVEFTLVKLHEASQTWPLRKYIKKSKYDGLF